MTQTKTLRQKFIGDKTFYKMVLAVAVPIVIQNGITNFVNLLDNVMVGQLGTESMSGVAIANQLIFVFNLCIFGGLSGAGIFGAQYHGSGNHDGVRQTFRFKLYVVAVLSAIFLTAFITKDAELLSLYLHQSESGGDLALTLSEGQLYLHIMLLGLVPFALNNVYIGTLRETGETLLPMKAGVTAVLVNLVFNWLLIFGNLGFPELGVAGAAIATVLSRYVELAIVVIWTHSHKEKNRFIVGVYKSLRVTKEVYGRVIRKGWPLLLNEVLWSIGMTTITQCYSTRGLSAVAAVNITSTLSNLFRIIVMASGNSIAILVGQRLGAGRMEEARDIDNKLIFASCAICALIGGFLFLTAPLFPEMYNTTADVKAIACVLLRVVACVLPLQAFNNAAYFTLRAGGKTFITFIFDSMFIWCVSLPAAFYCAHFTGLNVMAMYGIVQSLEIIKTTLGFVLIKKGSWLSNIV